MIIHEPTVLRAPRIYRTRVGNRTKIFGIWPAGKRPMRELASRLLAEFGDVWPTAGLRVTE
jgi:hypothetical protein